MPNQIFAEEVECAPWLNALMLGFAVLFGAALFFLIQEEGFSWESSSSLIIGLFILLGAINIFRTLRLSLTEEGLWFGYWKFGKQIHLVDITRLEEQQAGFKEFYGLGIRRSVKGVWGYINRFGTGLYLETRQGKKFFVSSNRADEWIAMIKSQQRQLVRQRQE